MLVLEYKFCNLPRLISALQEYLKRLRLPQLHLQPQSLFLADILYSLCFKRLVCTLRKNIGSKRL